MLQLSLLLLALACAMSLYSRRYWLFCVLLIGFLQDPLRKLVPGEPVFFVVFVAIVFACILVGQFLRKGVLPNLEPFLKWNKLLEKPLLLFVLILILQYAHSMFRYQNIIVSTIGLASYIAPILAVIVGYFSVSRLENIRIFMKVYATIGVLVAFSVLISYMGVDWTIFKEVGVGLKIYDQGTLLRSFSGFMRTGEIAAWHIATSICFIAMLIASSKRSYSLLIAALIVALMVLAIMLTGRRKMIMLISMFGIFFFIGVSFLRQSLQVKYLMVASLGAIAVWFGIEIAFPGGYGQTTEYYLARSGTVYSDATGRFYELGLKPIGWAYNRTGLLGGGLGIASQGASEFNVSSIAGGAGEGGLGKLMVELGLPGLLLVLWLMLAIGKYNLKTLQLTAQPFVTSELLPLMCGVAAFLGVNVLTFFIATQLYGDFFILIMIGLMAGFLFATPKLVVDAMRSHQPLNAI